MNNSVPPSLTRINLARGLMASLVCFLAIQLCVIVGQALILFDPQTKWDLVVYFVFVISATAGWVVVHLLPGDFLRRPQWQRLLPYWLTEAAITFGMLCAVYKMTIYDNSPALAGRALLVLGLAALVVKLAWREIVLILEKVRRHARRQTTCGWAKDAACLLLIAAVIYVPDPARVIAESFIGEQYHHFDFFIMSPGWAYLNGRLPYVEAISQYGVGVPAVLSKLSFLFGGFDYVPVLKMFIAMVIGYYILFYAFMRMWLGSRVLALAAFLVAFRLQMFHYGVSPLAWIYPSTTPIRFGLDMAWLMLVLMHIRTGQPLFLFAAALYSGAAVYYMTSTGMCVLATFYFYLLALYAVPSWRQQFFAGPLGWLRCGTYGLLPLISAGMLFWLTLESALWHPTFWHNLFEYLTFFSHGHAGGVLPIYESLKYRTYWAAFMAFIIPLLYLATLLSTGALLYFRKAPQEFLLASVIAVYGLANYQYFVVRSAMTSYYINAVPLVLLAAFWLSVAFGRLGATWTRRVSWALLLLSMYALTTNHNYISYPNLFNFSRNPMVDGAVAQHFPDRRGYFNHMVKFMKEEDKLPFNALGETFEDIRTEENFASDGELKEYWRRESDFSSDAKLIASLTKDKEPVALLSSFETKILMQAKRPPLFYHLPLISSQPMRLRAYPADAAHSPNFLRDTLQQLQDARPEYVFMERVFLQDKLPASYAEGNAHIVAIAAYVRTHYVAYQTGTYLVAMKRK